MPTNEEQHWLPGHLTLCCGPHLSPGLANRASAGAGDGDSVLLVLLMLTWTTWTRDADAGGDGDVGMAGKGDGDGDGELFARHGRGPQKSCMLAMHPLHTNTMYCDLPCKMHAIAHYRTALKVLAANSQMREPPTQSSRGLAQLVCHGGTASLCVKLAVQHHVGRTCMRDARIHRPAGG